MSTISAERLATVFVEVADTLVDDFDVIEFLQLLTQRVAGLFDTGQVGLMLADHRDRLTFMAASDESARLMEVFQLQHDDGPCLEAFRTGRAVANVNLAAADQWPKFAPRAAQAASHRRTRFPCGCAGK